MDAYLLFVGLLLGLVAGTRVGWWMRADLEHERRATEQAAYERRTRRP